jgi:DNA-binding transcriptional MerR regulator
MNIDIEEFKEVKGKEMAEKFDIANSTLRKYANILDQKGYRFRRNNKNHRVFKDEDEIVLKLMIDIVNHTDWRPNEAADIALLRLSGKTMEQAIEQISEKKNEVDPYVQRMQDYLGEKIETHFEGIELLREKQNLLSETTNEIAENQKQQQLGIQEINKKMITKEDVHNLIEAVKTKKDADIAQRDEDIARRDEVIRLLMEQNELLKQKELSKRKGFWAKILKL